MALMADYESKNEKTYESGASLKALESDASLKASNAEEAALLPQPSEIDERMEAETASVDSFQSIQTITDMAPTSPLSDESVEESKEKEEVVNVENTLGDLHITPRRKQLSGAAKKRYKYWRDKGHNPQEAHELALKPMETTKSSKRTRSDDSTPKTEPKKSRTGVTQQEPNHGSSGITPNLTFGQAVSSIKLGIVAANFPQELLTVEQMRAIQDSILGKIMDQSERDIKPKFNGATYKPGWLTLACGDAATAEWLKASVPALKPWEGATLKVVDEENIPRAQIVVAYLPNSEKLPTEKILELINGQNEGIRAKDWKVLRRAPEGSMTQLTLTVDHASAEKLQKANFRINYQFGQVQLRPKTGPHKYRAPKNPGRKGAQKKRTVEAATSQKPPSPDKKPEAQKGNSSKLNAPYPDQEMAKPGPSGLGRAAVQTEGAKKRDDLFSSATKPGTQKGDSKNEAAPRSAQEMAKSRPSGQSKGVPGKKREGKKDHSSSSAPKSKSGPTNPIRKSKVPKGPLLMGKK